MFVGFNATFLPMGFMGLEGMARRVYTYPPVGHCRCSTRSPPPARSIMALGVALLFLDILLSARGERRRANTVGRLLAGVDDDVAAARVQLRFAAGYSKSHADLGSRR